MSLGVDQIRRMKEEKIAGIWFGRFDIGEGSLDMMILGVYILSL